jgi:two-component system KDP operon response regulator KdpE
MSAMPPADAPRVLVVDDEAPMRRFLRASLSAAGYAVEEAATGAEALRLASSHPPDAVLLDLGLPDLDGVEVLRRMREWTAVPVVVVSARGREGDKIEALDAGADDFVTKPFAIGELGARLRAALRRAARPPGEEHAVVTSGPLVVDLGRRRVTLAGADVKLTPIEYRLLATLARHPGRVLTHAALLREVWGPGSTTQHHYLRVFMAQLRRKLEADSSRPQHLLTEPGVGYRLRDPDA